MIRRFISGKQNRKRARGTDRLKFEFLESRSLMAADILQLDQASYSSEHFLVQFREGTPASAVIGTYSAGATVTQQLTSDGWFRVSLAPGANLANSLQAFQALSNVTYVTPDFRVSIAARPNDVSYASQWALENSNDADIDASQAWSYGTSSSVVVGVIDTGVDYTHPDLAANMWSNSREIAGNGLDDDRNGYVDDIRGWNFVSNNNNPMDDNGHGTHVAGTIGAVGNNGVGVAGVAWSVKIMALKFLDAAGSGNLSDAVSAIDYARSNGAKIINASWGGGGFSSALQTAIQRFQSVGGIFVAAAGNEGSNNAATASFPANYSGVVSVAASTNSDTLASFSNYGTNVAIAAPGQNILSTLPGNRYGNQSGTSMAAPHVAGALALLWGQSPSLTATQLTSALLANTDPVLTNRTVHGRLNVGKAAAALAGNGNGGADAVAPHVVRAVFNNSASGISSIDVSFSEPMRAASMTPAAFSVSGPSGSVRVTSVTQIDSTTWRVNFANQTAAGNYSLTVLPTVSDVAGNLLNQDRDATAGEATQDRYVQNFTLPPSTSSTFTRTGPIAIRDATNVSVGTTLVTIDVPNAFTIRDLNVNLSIDHTYVSDLRIRLIAPDGTSVQLVNRRGGASDNVRVTFDDEATNTISRATTLNGTFRPERSLSLFDGKNAAGRWTLEIVDADRLDAGTFNSVQLRFNETSSAASTGVQSTQSGEAAARNSSLSFASWAATAFEEWLRRLYR